jgi:hypothetical protein
VHVEEDSLGAGRRLGELRIDERLAVVLELAGGKAALRESPLDEVGVRPDVRGDDRIGGQAQELEVLRKAVLRCAKCRGWRVEIHCAKRRDAR